MDSIASLHYNPRRPLRWPQLLFFLQLIWCPMEPMLTIALRAARKAGELIERALERVGCIGLRRKRPQ